MENGQMGEAGIDRFGIPGFPFPVFHSPFSFAQVEAGPESVRVTVYVLPE
jgi:hypothetical protein